MGRFNQLPHDVMWLIYRYVLKEALRPVWSMSFAHFEVGYFELTMLTHNGPNSPNHVLNTSIAALACISKSSLALIKKKTIRKTKTYATSIWKEKRVGWLFVKGALSQ